MEINILVAAVILLKAAIPFSQPPPLWRARSPEGVMG